MKPDYAEELEMAPAVVSADELVVELRATMR